MDRKTILNDEKYLRQISKQVNFKDKELKSDIYKIKKFCLEAECFALAAVQIGIPKRIIYLKNTRLDVSLKDKSYNENKIIINPVIKDRKGKTKYYEACVSCLDYMGLVTRPYYLTLEYYNENLEKVVEDFQGFEATVVSHELDHLDGILHMDIAEQVLEMKVEQRKLFREKHPYKVISKTCEYIKGE